MKVGYIRVSTLEQNIERQEVIMEKLGVDKVFIDKMSGKNKERPQLNEMLNFIRKGDELIVESISRLGRNTKDVLSIVEVLENKKVKLISQKEQLDTSTTIGRFMLTMLSALAELEREQILERVREGIAIAKAQGKFKGRPRMEVNKDLFKKYYEKWKEGVITAVRCRKELCMSHATFYRKVREFENNIDKQKMLEDLYNDQEKYGDDL